MVKEHWRFAIAAMGSNGLGLEYERSITVSQFGKAALSGLQGVFLSSRLKP